MEICGRKKVINNKRLILLSNREPYSHEKIDQGIICKKAVGGVVSALDPLIQQHRGIWIAWGSGSADFTVCNSEKKVLVPEEDPKYFLKRVPLSKEDVENYYRGFSNRVLWPLFHLFVDKMYLKEEYWDSYYKINKRFAQAAIDEIDKNHRIWIHDYHLSLVPQFIREARPNAKIAFFWHIPWPPWEVFDSLPQRDELLEGMLKSDLIGFHTRSYVKNFMGCASKKRNTKVNISKGIVTNLDNKTKIMHFPLGICYNDFAHSEHAQYTSKKARRLKILYKVEHLILGIDRLDYTKGILSRLKAFELFLEQCTEFRENVVFTQVVTPSRSRIKEYSSMKREIDETVGQINGRFGTEEWTPIKYFYRKIPQKLLISYYKVADIGLLTPLRDGMNLVAKEYIATNRKNGVLILSEFAGASEELTEAIIVNPYDIQETADAIKKAIIMPIEERKQRFKAMKKKVKQHDSEWWINNFLEEWEKTYA